MFKNVIKTETEIKIILNSFVFKRLLHDMYQGRFAEHSDSSRAMQQRRKSVTIISSILMSVKNFDSLIDNSFNNKTFKLRAWLENMPENDARGLYDRLSVSRCRRFEKDNFSIINNLFVSIITFFKLKLAIKQCLLISVSAFLVALK